MNKNYLLIIVIFINFIIIQKNIKFSPKNNISENYEIVDLNFINQQNKRIDKIFCKINIKQGLFSAQGFVAYEKPNNFRMIASSFLSKEIDIGSNSEYFWFWSNNLKPKALYYCKHKQLKNSNLKDIFYPEVLKSFLGIDEIKHQKIFDDNLKKIITFENNKITSHLLFKNNKLVISAKIKEFQKVENIFLPKKIEIYVVEEDIFIEWILQEVKINKFDYNDYKMPIYKEKINIGL